MNKLLVICGATATGKTELAVNCAKKINSEVVSADSQLVYKGLNIGTAKPTPDEMCGIVHHMIDVVEPSCNFSVSDYAAKAEPIVDCLLAKGKTPVVCGGTGFYINSLLYDLSYGNAAADESVRLKYQTLLEEKGREYVYELLKSVDPQSAATLHVNDTKRIIRALEIYAVSGKRKSDLNDGFKCKRDYVAVAIDYPRDELYKRINARVDKMFESGLVEEVKGLIAAGIDEKCRCMQAIGYKEVFECLKTGKNDSTMRDTIKQNTRHYAKRQITFFKKIKGIIWLKPENALVDTVTELLYE